MGARGLPMWCLTKPGAFELDARCAMSDRSNLLDYLREAKRGLTPEQQQVCDDFVIGVLSLHVAALDPHVARRYPCGRYRPRTGFSFSFPSRVCQAWTKWAAPLNISRNC